MYSGYEEEYGRELLKRLAEDSGAVVAVDTETTGLRVAEGEDRVIGISIASVVDGEPMSHYFPIRHEKGSNCDPSIIGELAVALDGKGIIFANVQFDIIGLLNEGLDLRQNEFYDIPTMAVLIDENNPITKSLDELGRVYCNARKVDDPYIEKEKKTGNHNITPEEMWDYACVDAELTYRVWMKMIQTEEWIRISEETDLWEAKQDTIRVLIEMRRRGVKIDVDLTTELEALGLAQQARLREEMQFNPGSHADNTRIFIEELGLPVLKRSAKTKKPSFDKEVMEQYDLMLEKLDSPIAKLVKEYRGWNKATSACYTPYLALRTADDRIHTTFNTHRTVTGRLSSSEPNLQQVPKETDKPWNGRVKECFVPSPGYVLLSADYSQLELRLGTAYSGEPSLKKVFAEGGDIFTMMAGELGMSRDHTKRFVYSMQYGAGLKKTMTGFSISKQQAQRMIDNYKSTYRAMSAFNNHCMHKAEAQGFVTLWSGRRRRFRYKSESYKAMNSVIQGGAADIVERVMVRVFREVDTPGECEMLLQVHDALVFEVREDLVEKYTKQIRDVMEDVNGALPDHLIGNFDVKFAVEVTPWSGK